MKLILIACLLACTTLTLGADRAKKNHYAPDCHRPAPDDTICDIKIDDLKTQTSDDPILVRKGDVVIWHAPSSKGKKERFKLAKFTEVGGSGCSQPNGDPYPFMSDFGNDKFQLQKATTVDSDATSGTCWKHSVQVEGDKAIDPHVIIGDQVTIPKHKRTHRKPSAKR